MEYYLLKMSENVSNALKPYATDESDFFNKYEEQYFDKLPHLTVGHFEYNEWVEVTDILENPILMISDKIKSVIENYNEKNSFKAVQLYSNNMESMLVPLFWIAKFESVDCIHSSAEFHPNKWIKKLILDEKKINDRNIFKVDGLLETKIILNLRVCESILRRKPIGISFEKVEVI